MEVLYLIDGYAQIFRAYYAIRNGMNSPVTSEPTHAVFGFTGMLLKLFTQFKPHYVVVAVDAPGPTFRDDLYRLYAEFQRQPGMAIPPLALLPLLDSGESIALRVDTPEEPPVSVGVTESNRYAEYKGTRRATPDDLTSQIDRIFEVIEGFGIPILGQTGLEADDVIATITQRILDDPTYRDVQIRIVSKDKDLEQLICDRVSLFDIHTDTLIDAPALLANKGITPEQVIDVLALMGDNVDNVPGVEGIGPKTAGQLVQQFGSVEGVLSHLDEIKGAMQRKLIDGRDSAFLSKRLATILRDVPVQIDLPKCVAHDFDKHKVEDLFRELEFNHQFTQLARIAVRAPNEQMALFAPAEVEEA